MIMIWINYKPRVNNCIELSILPSYCILQDMILSPESNITEHSMCTFCRIVSGELPSGEITRTQNLIAFTSLEGGYPLVATLEHVVNMLDPNFTEEVAAEFGVMTSKLARVVAKTDDVTGVTILVNNGKNAGQEINHFHGHIVPRLERDGLIIARRANRTLIAEREERAKRYKLAFI